MACMVVGQDEGIRMFASEIGRGKLPGTSRANQDWYVSV